MEEKEKFELLDLLGTLKTENVVTFAPSAFAFAGVVGIIVFVAVVLAKKL